MLQEVDRPLTFGEMMEAIHQEVRRRQASERSGSALEVAPAAPAVVSSESLDWSPIEQNLRVAEQFAPISSLPPQFVEWGKYKRAMALGVARGIMYVSRFITNKQTLFNESLLGAVRQLSSHAQAMAEQQRELAVALKRYEAQTREIYASMSVRMEALAARVGDLESQASSGPKVSAMVPGHLPDVPPAKVPSARQARKRQGSGASGNGK